MANWKKVGDHAVFINYVCNGCEQTVSVGSQELAFIGHPFCPDCETELKFVDINVNIDEISED